MATITDEQLAEWKRLSDAAPDIKLKEGLRRGNWVVVFDGVTRITVSYDIAQFIAAAREAMPALLAEVSCLYAVARRALDAEGGG